MSEPVYDKTPPDVFTQRHLARRKQRGRLPRNYPIGTKVRDIYTGKVSTVSKSYWQWYAGPPTSDYTVEFAEGGWNKSTNLEEVAQ